MEVLELEQETLEILENIINIEDILFSASIMVFGKEDLNYSDIIIADLEKELHDKIYHKDYFQETLKEYKIFVRDYVKFLKVAEITLPTDTALFYQECLDNGYLSATGEHNFKNFYFDIDNYMPGDLLGTRIMTGSAVCRHNASFLTDVIKEQGGIACNILSRPSLLEIGLLPYKLQKNNTKIYNHLITAFIENGHKFAYDSSLKNGVNIIDNKGIELGKGNCNVSSYLLYDGDYMKNETEERDEIRKCSSLYISPKKWENKKDEIQNKFNASKDNLIDFYKEQKKRLEYLKEMNEKIYYHTDQKVKII